MAEQNDDNFRDRVDAFRHLDLFQREFTITAEQLELTTEEVEARQQWNQQRAEFQPAIEERLAENLFINSHEAMLRNYVLPPNFATGKEVSKRSKLGEKRSKRRYPPNLDPWQEFETTCTNEVFSTDNLAQPVDSCQITSVYHGAPMAEEADEHSFFKNVVFSGLQDCGLMTGVFDDTSESREVIIIGRPDDIGVHGNENRVTSIIEVKSSQNLLIPNAATEVCNRYNRAFTHQVQTRSPERSLDWSRIGHPVAQMLGYMIDNNVMYGALCSASKTYFFRLVTKVTDETENNRNDNKVGVEVTRAYITCERDFLRSWAVFFRLSNRDNAKFTHKPPLIRYETPNGLYHFDEFEFERDFVPYVKYEDLKDKTYISEGRNGVVFSARINGEEYAVKQFDLSKNFTGYRQEILAYKHLRNAWGTLVPTPYFVSASITGNVRFLAMTKGNSPRGFTMEDIHELGSKLINDYGFRHLDNSHGRNYVEVDGKLMMIDFETWENLAEEEGTSPP